MKRAIVIGISDYSQTPLESLGAAEADARAVAECLAQEHYDFEVQLVLDTDASKSRINELLLMLLDEGPSSILFYFAGHGVSTPLGTYLATADAQDHDWGLDMSRVMQAVATAAPDSTVVLDCCHAGGASFVRSASSALVDRVQDAHIRSAFDSVTGSKALLAACQAHETAAEQASLGHGIFTYHLLAGLLGQAADHQGCVTVPSLFDYTAAHFSKETGQNPVFKSDLVGRVILGDGLVPVLAPPLKDEVARELEELARNRVDAYNRMLGVSADVWRASQYRLACDALDSTLQWFEKQISRHTDLLSREPFAAAHKSALTRQSHLGQVEAGTQLREGATTRTLGQGEFGTVWHIERSPDGPYATDLAYKIYHPSQLHQTEKVRRFTRGFEAMGQLDHPYVVPVFRFTTAPLGFFMQYIDGPNLRELGPATALEPAEIIALLDLVVTAVAHAHARDVIHRDIKPENVVCINRHGSWIPYLTDFDLAWFSTATRLTKAAMGTPVYAAPEQSFLFSANARVSRSSALDLYSLGQLLFFSVTGSDPLPLDIDRNADTLGARIADWPSGHAASKTLSLYRDAAQVKPSERLTDITEFGSRLAEIRALLSQEALSDNLADEDFARQLAFSCTGRYPSTPFDGSFRSSSEQTLVQLSITRVGKERLTVTAHLEPGGAVGLPGLSSNRMRQRLNQRIDKALRDQKTVHRRSGTSGVYSVFIDLDRVPPNADGIDAARDTLSRVMRVLESV